MRKDLVVAIHPHKGSFSDQWIEFCKDNNIKYKLVNAYASDIVQQLKGCDIFMWHWHHNDYKAKLFAKELLYSLEIGGMKVFPNSYTVWHFDDKIGQKYLFEAIDAPFIKTDVFYTKEEALKWVEHTIFPKIFKLRGGAASTNVKLIRSKEEAKEYIEIAFGDGFKINRFQPIKERIAKYKHKKDFKSLLDIPLRGVGRAIFPHEYVKQLPPEKNYIYVQEFLPNNDHDIRVTVFGKDRAVTIKRVVREDDFRASGSGIVKYDKEEIPKECIEIAFDVHKKIKSQCTSFDFIFDCKGEPKIVEISYGYIQDTYGKCPGYWDDKLNWYEGKFIATNFILEDLLKDEFKN
jgi:glutathione synthase/RimK-type ligase-like ATP-grasp enzyme